MSVRQRILPALIGLALFTAFGSRVSADVWTPWWFYVGVGIVIASVFVEPFHTRPQDAVVNGIGGIAAWATVEKAPVETLWNTFFGFCIFVVIAGVLCAVAPVDLAPAALRAKDMTYQFSKRFGRALVIGSLALFLEVVRLATVSTSEATGLAIGTFLLVAALGPNWQALVRTLRGAPSEGAQILTALGPKVLLVQATGLDLSVGESVEIEADGKQILGWITAVLPSAEGLRYEVIADCDLASLPSTMPSAATVRKGEAAATIVGAAGAGSTDLTLSFTPLRPLRVGDAVILADTDRLVYQVTSLELAREAWMGSASVVPSAVASQVGRPEHQYCERIRRCQSHTHSSKCPTSSRNPSLLATGDLG